MYTCLLYFFFFCLFFGRFNHPCYVILHSPWSDKWRLLLLSPLWILFLVHYGSKLPTSLYRLFHVRASGTFVLALQYVSTPLSAFYYVIGDYLTSWNIRGLKDFTKCKAILDSLSQYGTSIACIQETRLTKDSFDLLKSRTYPVQYYSVFFSYARGVIILISARVQFSCWQAVIDTKGRYIFLICSIDNFLCILGNVYVPPPYNSEVTQVIAKILADNPGVPFLAMGDFNIVWSFPFSS